MFNTILANNNTVPVLNEAATVLSYSDRYPCTVISVTDKEIIVQEDHARRIDSNGMSETQNYDYSRNVYGRTFTYRKVTIHYNLTKEEAKQHCQDRESSSSSCTSKTGKARTRKYGPWFDSYMLDN